MVITTSRVVALCVAILTFAAMASYATAQEPTPAPTQTALPGPAPSATPSGPVAGQVPASLTITITGDPASGDFVAGRIRAALDRAIVPTIVPGARIQYGAVVPEPESLGRGFQTTFVVPVTIDAGAGAAPVSGSVNVDVSNLDIAPFAPATLFLDDDPERIAQDGVAFTGTVDATRPARIYYYHEMTADRRRLVVLLSTPNGSPSRVQVVDAHAGPDADVMGVGHAVSLAYVTRKHSNEGVVLDLSGPFVLRDAVAGPGNGIAGAVDVRVLAGAAVTVTVLALPLGADATAVSYAKLAPDGHHRHGVFAIDGFGSRIVAFTVGGPDASVSYGERSPDNVDPSDGGRDYGSYGVLHEITFNLSNPTDTPATLYVYEEPDSGVARNSFLVDGVVHEMGCARVSNRYQIAVYQLAAKTNATIRVETMPDGGSNYPVEIGMTATPPAPATPPMTAPDGCFPTR